MGLINFNRDKGTSLGHKDDNELERAIENHIRQKRIDVDNLKVDVKDGIATVGGVTKTQAEREYVVTLAGNVQGIERVNDQVKVNTPVASQREPESTYYTVKSGDSLSKISQQHYGDPMQYNKIFEANRHILDDPDKIYPGQTLRIPQK